MKKLSYLSALLLTIVTLGAQAQNMSFAPTDVGGRAVGGSKYQHINGSPYIFDEWLPGEVVTEAGKLNKGMLLKYDIGKEMLTFVYRPTEEPLQFAEPIAGFTIYGEKKMSFMKDFPKIDGNGKDSYYEVLVAGKAMLLKHYRQYYKEVLGTDLTKSNATYAQKATYYVFKDGKMASLRPNAKAIQQILADRPAQVDSLLNAEKPDLENEENLKKVFDAYNTSSK